MRQYFYSFTYLGWPSFTFVEVKHTGTTSITMSIRLYTLMNGFCRKRKNINARKSFSKKPFYTLRKNCWYHWNRSWLLQSLLNNLIKWLLLSISQMVYLKWIDNYQLSIIKVLGIFIEIFRWIIIKSGYKVWTNPGSSTPQKSSYIATYLPSHKLFKNDILGIAGVVERNL